jgi:glucose/arabinose dehydrogenase
VAFVQDPTDPNVQFVVEQGGTIKVVQNGTVLATPFLSVAVSSSGEQGLLGLAFPPNTATTGWFFVNFTNPAGDTVVARFRRSANPLVADASSRFDLRWIGAGNAQFIDQPFANHNGGHLAFGADGYLYIGLGDGGSGNDPENNAQRRDTLLGKMLRIDVNVAGSHPNGYTIPPDNPFVAGGAPPEVWSFGWRNPWRYSFDDVSRGGTGALIAGDVGQGRREEINYEPRGRGGRNYGWRNFEGTLSNVGDTPPAYQPLTPPIHEYDRSLGASITGGIVYRGTQLGAANVGRYFYADFISSRVYSLGLSIGSNGEATVTGVPQEHTNQLGGTATLQNVSSFGVDANGEMYIVSYGRGVILRVIGAPSPPTNLRIIR